MKKCLSLILIILTLLGTCVCPISAQSIDSGVAPCYNNTHYTMVDFTIDDSTGMALIFVEFLGYEGITTVGCVEVKLQKKTWGLFWTDVENGRNENTWTTYFAKSEYYDEIRFQLPSKGTYRALITFTINGNGGDADVIEYTKEDKYS